MVKTADKLPLSRSARNGWVYGCIQDQLGLLKGILLTKVAQELKEPEVPRQVRFAETTKHSQIGLEQGKHSEQIP
jgi:hypothetical protein